MSSSMDYDIYRDDLAHTQDAAQRGIIIMIFVIQIGSRSNLENIKLA